MVYRTSREGSALVVHDVEIFCSCVRGEKHFDEVWIQQAVAQARQAEGENFFAPVHVRHHKKVDSDVRAAGFFRVNGTAMITLKGTQRTAILVDMVITDATVEEEILNLQLPYRSVEIFNVDRPAINGLALLDHEAPFLELPMLAVQRPTGVAPATFGKPWTMQGAESDPALVASFSHGQSTHLLFRSEDMNAVETKDLESVATATAPIQFAEDGPPEKKDDDKSEDASAEGGDDIEAAIPGIAKAISDGSISVKSINILLEAIQGSRAETDDVEAPAEEPAPAAAPGGAMSKNIQTIATMQAQLDALQATNLQRDTETTRTTEVRDALTRLGNRPIPKLEEKLLSFHAEHGAPAFAAYVEALEENVGPVPIGTSARTSSFSAQSTPFPSAAMVYEKEGVDAVEQAAHFQAQWADLNERGYTRLSEESYIANNMARRAI